MKLKEFKVDLKPDFDKHNFSSNKNIINRLLMGNYESTFKRSGMEFSDYRKYTLSDDANKIDWKASMKSQKLLIKETIEEKALNIIFLVDVSNTMLCSSQKKLKCEYVAEIVCNLSFAIQREGNAIGLFMFNNKGVARLPPTIGVEQYYNILEELKNPKNYGGKCNFKKALKESVTLLRIPSLVILISDYISLSKDWEKYLKIISSRYSVLGMMIRDPIDKRIPKNSGYYVLEDPSSNEKIIIDTKEYYKKYKEYTKKNVEELSHTFKKARSSLLVLDSDKDFFNPLINFLEKQVRMKAR